MAGHAWTVVAARALGDVTSYLAGRPHWSRVTTSRHVQCLRSFFRHAAMRGWVRPGLAETIDAPRLYTHERLPQGPRWTEVQQLLNANRSDAPAQIRNYAMLVLLAIYGFRSGEVCALTLDDIDWEHGRIHPPRPKQRRVGQYPWSVGSPTRSCASSRRCARVARRVRCLSRCGGPIDPGQAAVFRRRCASPSSASARHSSDTAHMDCVTPTRRTYSVRVFR
jgi:integrase